MPGAEMEPGRGGPAGPPANIMLDGALGLLWAPACISSSGTLRASISRAAASPLGGTAEYGAATATGCPHGPCTPGTVGGPPVQPPLPKLPLPAPGPAPVETQPPSAATMTNAPAVRFINCLRRSFHFQHRSSADILDKMSIGTFIKSVRAYLCGDFGLLCFFSCPF